MFNKGWICLFSIFAIFEIAIAEDVRSKEIVSACNMEKNIPSPRKSLLEDRSVCTPWIIEVNTPITVFAINAKTGKCEQNTVPAYKPKHELFPATDLIEISNTPTDSNIIEIIVKKESAFIFTSELFENLFNDPFDEEKERKFAAFQFRIKFTTDKIISEERVVFFDENKKMIASNPWEAGHNDENRSLENWDKRYLAGSYRWKKAHENKSLYVCESTNKELKEEIVSYFIGESGLEESFYIFFTEVKTYEFERLTSNKEVSYTELLDFAKDFNGKVITFKLRF